MHSLLESLGDSLLIHSSGRAVSYRSTQVDLSPIESRVLARLLNSPGSVVQRHELWAAAWREKSPRSDNLVDQCVSKLRRKLRVLGAPYSIRAVRGIGHQLMAHASAYQTDGMPLRITGNSPSPATRAPASRRTQH